MTTPDLLPCPFCGGEAKIDGTSWTSRDGKDQAWATCKRCGAYGPSAPDAITAWNTRASGDLVPRADVEGLVEAAKWLRATAQSGFRTADFHRGECSCPRCAEDALFVALTAWENSNDR